MNAYRFIGGPYHGRKMDAEIDRNYFVTVSLLPGQESRNIQGFGLYRVENVPDDYGFRKLIFLEEVTFDLPQFLVADGERRFP